MKRLLCRFCLIMIIACILSTSASATYEIKNGTITWQRTALSRQSYCDGLSSHDPYYETSGCVQWSDGSRGGHAFSFDEDGGYENRYNDYIGVSGVAINGCKLVYSRTDSVQYRYISNPVSKVCGRRFTDVSWTCPVSGYNGYLASDYKTAIARVYTLAGTSYPFNLVSCNTNNITLTGKGTINGGTYVGQPAVSSNSLVINKATLTDKGGSHSTFVMGDDSESSVTTSESQTITTVKLSNPPVIIDWADFPG